MEPSLMFDRALRWRFTTRSRPRSIVGSAKYGAKALRGMGSPESTIGPGSPTAPDLDGKTP